MKQLESSPFLKNVQFDNRSSRTDQGKEVTQFTLDVSTRVRTVGDSTVPLSALGEVTMALLPTKQRDQMLLIVIVALARRDRRYFMYVFAPSRRSSTLDRRTSSALETHEQAR